MMQSYQFLSLKKLNMSGLVRCELIRFYKHVKTCFEVLKPLMQIDTILQTCPDLS